MANETEHRDIPRLFLLVNKFFNFSQLAETLSKNISPTPTNQGRLLLPLAACQLTLHIMKCSSILAPDEMNRLSIQLNKSKTY